MGDNSAVIQAREKETQQIVKSIQDLNEIFKDLATMIIDQVFHDDNLLLNNKMLEVIL